MGIPFQSVLDDDERNVSGAFFRTLPLTRDSYAGALLLIDARGEPVEFTYNRASVKHRFLWRDRDLQAALIRELLASLLETCPRTPTALFCLAREVEPAVFLEDLDVQRPVARVAAENETVGLAAEEVAERVDGPTGVQLFWVRGRPSDATDAQRLVQRLASRGLLLEPFERVVAGLRETYQLGDGAEADGDSES